MKTSSLKPVPPPAESISGEGPDLYHELRHRIVIHEIPPGSRLREQQLIDEFGVSRAKVREVLAALEQRGLVERIPNRGAVVIKLDTEQIVDIYVVREVLEGLMVRLATEKTSPEFWRDLLEEFDGPMRVHLKNLDFEAFIEGYEKFRRQILSVVENPALEQMMDSIYEKTHMTIRRVLVLPGRAERGLNQHIAVLQAMCRGDALEAELLRRENMKDAREALLRYKNFIL